MSLLKQAILANSEGIDYFARGQHELALRTFENAIVAIRLSTSFRFAEDFASIPIAMFFPPPQLKEFEPHLSKQNVFVCARPLFLEDLLRDFMDDQDRTPNITLIFYASIVFNMALVHHAIGVSGKERRLLVAINKYNECQRILQGSIRSFDSTIPALGELISLMALTNLANIYEEQCQYGMALSCMEDAYSILSSPKIDEEKLMLLLGPSEMEKLTTNVVLFCPAQAARAA